MKGIVKSSIQGIMLAMCIFAVVCMIFDLVFKGTFKLENYQMTKMVIGCIICGIGYGAPSVVYNSEKLAYPVKILIHMGIASVIYVIVAFNVGWLGNDTTLGTKVVIICCLLALSFVLWFGFAMYYRRQSKKMNEKLQQKK